MTIKVKTASGNWVAINTRQISYIEQFGESVLVYCAHGLVALPLDQFNNIQDAMKSDD